MWTPVDSVDWWTPVLGGLVDWWIAVDSVDFARKSAASPPVDCGGLGRLLLNTDNVINACPHHDVHTPMNACLHLASHAGTVHDLAPATHANCPPLQLHRPHRPLHTLTHAMHNVVHSREARGLQTVPTPNPHATNTCAEYAQAVSPRYLQRPLWRFGRRMCSPSGSARRRRAHYA